MRKLLVLDDDRLVRETIAEALRACGDKIVCAAAADDARWLLAGKRFDLVIADCVMRGEQGEDLARHAAALGVPVLLTSGHPERLRAIQGCGFPVLAKPFRLSELYRAVDRALAGGLTVPRRRRIA